MARGIKCIVFGVSFNSFNDACNHYGINTRTAREYKDKYKLSEEQAIDHYINGTDYSGIKKLHGVRVNNLTKIVVIDGVEYNYTQAIEKYKLSYKGIDKVMEKYNINDRGVAIEFCIKNNLAKKGSTRGRSIIVDGIEFKNLKYALEHYKIYNQTYNNYKNKLGTDNSELIIKNILVDRQQYLYVTNIGNFKSFKQLCTQIGLTDSNIYTYMGEEGDKLKALTKIVKNSYIDDNGVLILPENIELNIKKKRIEEKSIEYKGVLYKSAKEMCEAYNVKYNRLLHISINNNIGYGEALDILLEELNNLTLSDLCKKSGLDFNKVNTFKHRHPELTEEQIIEYYKNKPISLKEKGRLANVNYNTISSYKQTHPEITDNQVICKYNPNCYINILGQLVIPQEDGTKIVLD